jgi:hypothetical protein
MEPLLLLLLHDATWSAPAHLAVLELRARGHQGPLVAGAAATALAAAAATAFI